MNESAEKRIKERGFGIPKRPSKGFWRALIYLLLPALALVVFVTNRNSSKKEITWHQFETEIISRKAVERIVVMNKESAEVYIKKEFANNAYFKDVMKSGSEPQFFFNIGSVESFEQKMDEAQKSFQPGEKIIVSYTRKLSWFWSAVSWLLTIILLFLLWNFDLGRSTGMGSSGGSSILEWRADDKAIEKIKQQTAPAGF